MQGGSQSCWFFVSLDERDGNMIGMGFLRMWTIRKRNLPVLSRWAKQMAGFLWVLTLWPQGVQAAYQQWDLAADVKSRFSTGCSSVQELMDQAEARQLDGLLFGDHDRKSIQYGVPYVERVLRIKMGSPSLLDNGAGTYLSELNQIDKTDDSLVLVPGVESAPFYYWTGNPLDMNLVAHNWDKHLLIIGLPNSRDYEELPTLNSSFTTRYLKDDYLIFLIFCIGALFGFYGFMGKRRRGISFMFALVMGLLAANTHPFKSSPFDQYEGDQGVEPYQHLIDYADSKGALVFWNHLETPVSEQFDGDLIQVKTRTDPHPEDLLLTRRYTGFQAVSASPVSAVEPGKEWDQVLMQYLGGKRDRPVWGYGANDFRCEGKNGDRLGEVRTVVLTSRKSRPAMVNALGAGRMYAVKQGEGTSRLSLDAFELVEPETGNRAVMGQELKTAKPPGIRFKLSRAGNEPDAQAKIRLIRNGHVVKQSLLKLPYEGVWQDAAVDISRRGYYRLLVEIDAYNQLVSNPIFFGSGHSQKTEVASAKTDSSSVSLPTHEEKTSAPITEPPVVAPIEKYMKVTGRSVRLRKGPSTKFPVVGKVTQGERLLFVRRTDVMYKGKAWVVIKKEGKLAYVWEGLVKELPANQRN
jgi:hypothetical protein